MSSHIEVKRKKGETFEALMRRFTRRLQQSGKVLSVKGARYWTKDKNETKVHNSKLRSLEKGSKRDYLLRTGKLVEEDFKKRR